MRTAFLQKVTKETKRGERDLRSFRLLLWILILFTPLVTNLPGQPGTTTSTDTNAVGAGPVFYRVAVRYWILRRDHAVD